MMAFKYPDAGRKMVASAGYTGDATDYNLSLDEPDFAVTVNDEKLVSGQGKTAGANEVDFVLA